MFMISIREFTDDDIKKYSSIFQCAYDLYNDYSGLYYILEIDGVEQVLYRMENIFTLFSLNNQKISYSVFTIDHNYEVIDAGFDDFETHLVNNHMIVQNRETLFTQCLSLEKRENGVDVDGYNGIIMYSQYDPELDIRSCLTYQQMYNENSNKIYQSHIEVPFTYTIEENVTKRKKSRSQTYIKGEYNHDYDPFTFNIATMKDYGLISLLREGAINLQKTNKITRYYKILAYSPQKYAITGFPLTRQYYSSEIEDLFRAYGFNTSIPMYLLDLYNGEYSEMNLFNNIAGLIKDADLAFKEEDVITNNSFKLILR